MRLLLFSDLHNNAAVARDIVRDSRRVDVVIGAGDFCNMHRGLDSVVSILSRIERPSILVPGNAETTDELQTACRIWPSAHILHGSSVVIDGVTFFGIGGGIPVTPFGSWSYDFTESEAESLLASCPAGCVFVSHSPPKEVLDASSTRNGLGSTTIRNAILRSRSPLAVCGHIHDSGGRSEQLGETIVVNAGPEFPHICVLKPTADGSLNVGWEVR